jgi:16S rRNA (cytosine1402-N4)-methyltransferase
MPEDLNRQPLSGPSVHIPVLLREVIQVLELQPGLSVVDGTLGGGGHSREILKRIQPGGWLLGLDRDSAAIERTARDFHGEGIRLVHGSYVHLDRVLAAEGHGPVDRILLDLGLSSDQLADEQRGFSFKSSGPLDLRFDVTSGQPAWQWLASASETDIADALHRYGEEHDSRGVARRIVEYRSRRPLHTAADLAAAIAGPGGPSRRGFDKHPATRAFQALRIVVNEELSHIDRFLQHVVRDCLKPGGILAVISFHSLEDRLIKQAFRESESWQQTLSRPLQASNAEQRLNPRSRSAKLRAARRRP